jgi:flagellar biosynthesis/type III secretory pathway chaperone
MSDPRYTEIEALLDDERAALLAGDFTALPGLAERKEALLEDLAGSEPARGTLAALRGRAERNAELLAAASRGVRTVVRRIADIRDANGPLKTYGEDGRHRTLGSVSGALEKRA